MQKTIEITNGQSGNPVYRFKKPINLTICHGEQIAIVGNNGSGKSMLVDAITQKHPLQVNSINYDFSPSKARLVSDNIKHLTFRDSYGTSTDGSYYYQLRWNQQEIDDSTPIVGEVLQRSFDIAEKNISKEYGITDEEKTAISEERKKLRESLFALFNINELLDKYLISLSSGELRKIQITKTLLYNPRVLILDNPFIGLDVNARKQLHDLLKTLTEETSLQIILVLSKTDDIPMFVTHVVEMKEMEMMPKVTLKEYLDSLPDIPAKILSEEKAQEIVNLPYSADSRQDEPTASYDVINFNDVKIRYGERTILKGLNLTIKNGEHWALSGENGAGKSTLLSIVCADNPQAYANNITLFGIKRGSGESIWDIKKNIGYISPEMHRAFQKDVPCIDIVASGMNDARGLYKKPNPGDYDTCIFWMDKFGIGKFHNTSFLKLSNGEQRLVLLARAFVKDPALLILDEPLHGLDMNNRRLVKDIIETFCKRKNKTMIMVTHYENELPNCIDHKFFLKKNKD